MASADETLALVERAQKNDPSAFEALVASHRDRLEELVRRRLGSALGASLEVDDIVQETLAWAFRSLPRFRWQGEGSFGRWLAGIGCHVILKAARRERRGRTLELVRDVPAPDVSPSKALRRTERFERLETALAKLSSDHRQVILLARIEGLAIREIARRMARSEDAVMQLLSRALKKLKQGFGETESWTLPDRALETEPGGDE
jgi:RNA polymerase sigma-70 factor (ECF subfamily)